MTLKQLAREVQDVVKDGIATLLVWKKGRSWCYETSYYDEGLCPPKEEAEGLPSFTDVNGEEAWIFDRSDYLKAYGIEVDVTEVGMCYEYKTKAYFFIKEEAERYIKYQGHNLNKPRIYADGCGYGNKGEYEIFYNLLMKLGNIVNREERRERFRKFYSGKIC